MELGFRWLNAIHHIFFLVLLTFKYIFFLNFELEYKLLSYKIQNTLLYGSHMYI